MENLEKYNCAICRKPVLGLKPADVYLDTYLLKADDQALLDSGNYGSLHRQCMLRFPDQMKLWKDRIASHYLSLYADEPSKQMFSLADGSEFVSLEGEWPLSIQQVEIERIEMAENQILVQHEININLRQLSKSALQEMTAQFKRNLRFPLGALISALQLEDQYSASTVQVSAGYITPLADDPDETWDILEEGLLTATVHYPIQLSPDFLHMIA